MSKSKTDLRRREMLELWLINTFANESFGFGARICI